MMINRKCIWSLLLPIVNIEEMKRKIQLQLFRTRQPYPCNPCNPCSKTISPPCSILQSYPFNPCNPCSIKNLRITFYQTNSAFSDNNPCNPCSRTYASSHIKAPQYSQRILSVKSVLSVFKNPTHHAYKALIRIPKRILSVFPFLVHNSLLGRHPSILVYILHYHHTLLWSRKSGA